MSVGLGPLRVPRVLRGTSSGAPRPTHSSPPRTQPEVTRDRDFPVHRHHVSTGRHGRGVGGPVGPSAPHCSSFDTRHKDLTQRASIRCTDEPPQVPDPCVPPIAPRTTGRPPSCSIVLVGSQVPVRRVLLSPGHNLPECRGDFEYRWFWSLALE